MGKIKIMIFVLLLSNGYNVLAQLVIPLYQEGEPPNSIPLTKPEMPTMEAFFPAFENNSKVAVIIFPGGAYSFLALEEEGRIVAREFAKKGIAAFVVRYRLPNDQTMKDKSVGPLMDAQQAIMLVRRKANEWNIDIKKIGAIGYSAGGHLASTLGTHFSKSYIHNRDDVNLRPDFMILVYPVISMQDSLTHIGSRISLLGMEPTSEKMALFSNELQVSEETPPTYITHAGDDSIVNVSNSILFYHALQRKGVDVELHLFPKGNHGFTQRLPVNEWLNPMLDFLKRERIIE